MIDGYSLTKGSLRFINVSDWYLREVRAHWGRSGVPRLEERNPTRELIHTSAATISERNLPDALGLEVLEMVVKHVDQPIKGFDDKSTLQPSRGLTGRHVETVTT